MDELAAEVGVDPLEVREKNWIKHEEFPFTTVAGLEYDSGNYEAATAKAKEMFGYDELRAEQKRRRESGDTRPARHRRLDLHRDVRPGARRGCSARSTTAPAAGSTRACGCWPPARSRSITGASAHGQGHETAFSQIVADRLGVAFEDVEVLHGDTQIAPQGPRHLRLALAGRRWRGAGQGRRQGDREGQADRGAPARGLRRRPRVHRRPVHASRAPTRAWRSARSRSRSSPRTTCPTAWRRRIDSDATYDPVNFNYPHGTHLCAMEVDTETGQVTMRKYVCCRRHRQHHQPADRRRPGARRPGAGHRAGPVGGGGVRRLRHAGVRLLRGLPGAHGGRHDQLRRRAHHDPVD